MVKITCDCINKLSPNEKKPKLNGQANKVKKIYKKQLTSRILQSVSPRRYADVN